MSSYILNNKKQNIFDIEQRHNVKINFIIDNNLAVSDYKVYNSEDNKNADLDTENQHKDKISKKRKNQKKSYENNDIVNEKNSVLDEIELSFIEQKTKRGRKKAQPSKKLKDSKIKNFEHDNQSIKKPSENELNINQILDNEEKKPIKRKSRKTKSSTKIDVVNLNSEKNKVKTKKTGWWNN